MQLHNLVPLLQRGVSVHQRREYHGAAKKGEDVFWPGGAADDEGDSGEEQHGNVHALPSTTHGKVSSCHEMGEMEGVVVRGTYQK